MTCICLLCEDVEAMRYALAGALRADAETILRHCDEFLAGSGVVALQDACNWTLHVAPATARPLRDLVEPEYQRLRREKQGCGTPNHMRVLGSRKL
jgi:hypothetical protein